MAIHISTGPPTAATIILTEPKQLRFEQKFDKAYTIRYVYVPRPPSIDTMTQAFWLPDRFHQGLFYKFISMVAGEMGELQLAEVWELKYQRWLEKAKQMAKAEHLAVQGVGFSNFA